MTPADQKKVITIKDKWEKFKNMRNRPNLIGQKSKGWLTMLERESFLQSLLDIMEKNKKKITIYE